MSAHDPKQAATNAAREVAADKRGTIRTLIAGALMGIANIIPGVSGGTMLLAMGIYPRFVESVASFTRLQFRLPNIVFLVLVGLSAVIAIGLAAAPIDWALRNHHHAMFALFIGLTLGGVPLLWRDIDRHRASVWIGAAAGLLLMIALAMTEYVTELPGHWLIFAFAGILGAAAMVLPGISGSYLLLIFGLYLPIITAIKDFVSALKGAEMGEAFAIGLAVLLPVGIGVLVGIAGLTNALKTLLARAPQPTFGALLGLLVGSVIGLWPFAALEVKGEEIAPAVPFTPGTAALVVVLVLVGFAMTTAVARLGNTTR